MGPGPCDLTSGGRRMAVDNVTDLVAALARFEPELLVGTPEGPRIEFKRPAAYRLEYDSGKWELAKGVAAMANAEGGLIVIGVRHCGHVLGELPLPAVVLK